MLIGTVTLATAGCSAGGSDAGSADGSPGEAAGSVATTSGPVRLRFDTATDRAAEATVTPSAGGRVSATGPDGTRFELTVPAGAVAANTVIRVVPLTHLTGMPGDGPVVAARLEPDGAGFARPLTLVVKPGKAIARADRFAFTADQDGTEVRGAPVALAATAPTLYLTHFSMAGVAGVNDSALDAAIGVAGADRASQIGQQVTEQLQGAARGSIDSAAATARVTELLDQFDEEVAKPALDKIGSGPQRCSAVRTVANEVLGVMRDRAIYGLPASKIPLQAALQAAYQDCEREAIRRCKKARQTGPLVRFWAEQARTAALLGLGGGNDAGSFEKRARPICIPTRYRASGGGNGVTITGEVPDLSRPFVLSGTGDGFAITLRYTPADDTGRRGSMTYEGSGGGIPLSGSSTYTVSGEDGSALTLTQTGSGCAGPDCASGTEVITLTPIP